jgi:hypothetical protein
MSPPPNLVRLLVYVCLCLVGAQAAIAQPLPPSSLAWRAWYHYGYYGAPFFKCAIKPPPGQVTSGGLHWLGDWVGSAGAAQAQTQAAYAAVVNGVIYGTYGYLPQNGCTPTTPQDTSIWTCAPATMAVGAPRFMTFWSVTVTYRSTCHSRNIATGAVGGPHLWEAIFGLEGWCTPQRSSGDFDRNGQCITGPLLSLSGPPEVLPEQSVQFVAKVVDGWGSARSGVDVSFKSEVQPNSGGHDSNHPHASRPVGSFSSAQVRTDFRGEARATFSSPAPAGVHTITATCEFCSPKTVSRQLLVKVPDLFQIPADSASPPRYVFVGFDRNHSSRFNLRLDALQSLRMLVLHFQSIGWGQLGLNDASLPWGGLFEVDVSSGAKFWGPPHAGHRLGDEIDISFLRPGGISQATIKRAYDTTCDVKQTAIPANIYWHAFQAPHFHVYLLARDKSNPIRYRPCAIGR